MNFELAVLDSQDVIGNLQRLRERQPVDFAAFFSTQLGGVVTDPALMVLPFDDHMVHRGHAVFDTAIVAGGNVYQLEQHLDRLLLSASRAKIEPPAHRAQLRRIILDTAAASRCKSGTQKRTRLLLGISYDLKGE